MRKPRPTIRLRLTLLYGGLFLGSGVCLLVITYLLVDATGELVRVNTSNGPFAIPSPGQGIKGHAALVHDLIIESAIALAIMAVISIGLGWLVAGRVLRPLRTITAAAQRISANNLHERLALRGPADELKELADTFDSLLARLESSFAAQRQFVANASHELRTPLARQRTVLEVALADLTPSTASLQAACRRALAAGEQQELLIEALLTLARSQRGLDRRDPVDLSTITTEIIELRQAEAEKQALRLEAHLRPAWIPGDARLIERLAANLVDNAMRHNVSHGSIRLATRNGDGRVVFSVANTGPAVPEAQVARLFEPFQRLDATRGSGRDGLGLGLPIVRAIADAHDALLRARPRPGGGLEVEVHFPAGT